MNQVVTDGRQVCVRMQIYPLFKPHYQNGLAIANAIGIREMNKEGVLRTPWVSPLQHRKCNAQYA